MQHGFWYSVAAIARNTMRAEADLFRTDLGKTDALGLFRNHVELIEVETTSYCNRTCSFCPNSTIDRRSEKHSMPEPVWRAILSSLERVDYGGTFVWSRYSEPLSERRIVERIREARQAASQCRIAVNSNGDYLDREYLEELAAAGLNRLWIDLYLPDAPDYDVKVAQNYLDRLLSRIGNPAHQIISRRPELSCCIACSSLEIWITCRNSASMFPVLSSRAGLLSLRSRTERTSPCFAPFKHLVVDWDGSVMVCCQMRSDAAPHTSGIIGRIGPHLDLVEAYVRLAPWRASLVGFGEKSPPCMACNNGEYGDNRFTAGLSKGLLALPELLRAKTAKLIKPAARF